MEKSLYEVSTTIRRVLLNRAAEVAEYRWSDDFAVKYLRELPAKLLEAEWFRPIDPTQLTLSQMRELGFSQWSEDDKMMLLPLWMKPYLVSEFMAKCITGEHRLFQLSEMDNDNRGGCLAYGVFAAPE